ncbi:guanylate cyclase soluble subunit alpha-1-like [Mytilus edulis]|uniref:guanylate cyclase soluble subunit alpha-1-like n=1 Tax=Mytilus edulis TaxID=6550 RepID=UPI0039EE824F
MSCPFQTAVKKEIDTIKKQSPCSKGCNGTEDCSKHNRTKDKIPQTNGTLSGRDNSPSNKNRKESGLSLCSQASSDELDGEDEKKLGLVGLIESVGTLLLPSAGFIYRAYSNLLCRKGQDALNVARQACDIDEVTFSTAFIDTELRHNPVDEESILKLAQAASNLLQTDLSTCLNQLGREYVKLCLAEYGKALGMMGSNMVEFFSNLDGLHEEICKAPQFKNQTPPSFRCENKLDNVDMHFYSDKRRLLSYYAGIVQEIAELLCQVQIDIVIQPSESPSGIHHVFHINSSQRNSNNNCTICVNQSTYSSKPSDLKIGISTFCEACPFHVIVDRNLKIVQLGKSLMKVIASDIQTKGLNFETYFSITRPKLDQITFSALLSRVNFSFVLESKCGSKLQQHMQLKGQMIYLQESDSILFLGSPSIEKIDELIARGLYISDLPIHDATRDLILVGEQTKAQDGLKKRMEQMKRSIIEGTEAVEAEKKKNVELLHMIFPEKLASRLWRGETIEPMKIDEVTMLFSDIVGFTAICSSCTPLTVINMLNSLYTQFDHFCGDLDVYKVETIGDAYCVAGGLHRPSKFHAQQIAWMAIRMMDTAGKEKSHDGNTIRMRIGLHSGSVLAGIVGVRMPRYCLFGNNVTLANKFESGSEATRINISPTTYSYIENVDGFKFTPRSRENLPVGFPEDVPGICYFLDGYTYPGASKDKDVDHITLALKTLPICNETKT